MIKAVIFDFGGVILDSPLQRFQLLEEQLKVPTGTIAQINMCNHDKNAWARFERGEIAKDDFIELFEDEARQMGYQIPAEALLAAMGGRLVPEMIEAISSLRGRYRLGLLTNNFPLPSNTNWLTEVTHLFDVVVQSSQISMRKPEPEIYLYICQLLNVTPPEAIFLDDLGVNLKPARALGMHTIKVTSPVAAIEELNKVIGALSAQP